MRTYNPQFTTEMAKAANVPVNFLLIEFPAISGFPALTLRLTDRGQPGSPTKYALGGYDWIELVEDWGDIDAYIEASQMHSDADGAVRLRIVDLPSADLPNGVTKFSRYFDIYPPETARVTIFQWFEAPGMGAGNFETIFYGKITDPFHSTETSCEFDVVVINNIIGKTIIGNAITRSDFPNAPDNAIGKAMPIVIGAVDGVPGINVRVAAQTKLKLAAFPGQTTIAVAATDGFKSAGQIIIGENLITYTGKTTAAFTGVTGIDRIHNIDAAVIERVSDHRYKFADPRWPVKSIGNVKVNRQVVDAGKYSIDLASGEVIFAEKPQFFEASDSRSKEAAFGEVDAATNTAVNAANALNGKSRTAAAEINMLNRTLALKFKEVLPSTLGTIQQVFLRVQHFEDEKFLADSLKVTLPGIGDIDTLSLPSPDDKVTVVGQTRVDLPHTDNLRNDYDIDHAQGDTIAAPVADPQHYHPIGGDGSVTQEAAGGIGTFTLYDLQSPNAVNITFPSYSGSPVGQVEYTFVTRILGTGSSGAPGITLTPVALFSGSPISANISQGNWIGQTATVKVLDTSGNLLNPARIVTGSMAANQYLTFQVFSVTRRIIPKVGTSVLSSPTGVSTVKTGGVDPVAGTGKTTIKTGAVTPHDETKPLDNTADKTTQMVEDYSDITALVNGDWNWFTNRVAQINYTGSADGRAAHIVYVYFDIRYAERRVVYTDDVTADVEGCVDDGAGTITGTPGALIERPDHVFKFSILKLMGESADLIDSASFAAAGALYAAQIAGGYKLAGVIDKKTEARELWTDWSRCCRSYLVWTLGKCKLLFRPYNFIEAGDPSVKTLTDAMRNDTGIKAERTATANIANHIEARYKWDYAAGDFTGMEIKEDALSVSIYGRRELPDRFNLKWVRGAAMAADLAAFNLQEYMNPLWVVTFDLFLDNMDLEPGDIVKLNTQFKNFNNAFGLVLSPKRGLGSGAARKMDAVPVTLRLFPAFIVRLNLGDNIGIADSVSVKIGAQFNQNLTLADAAAILHQTAFSEAAAINDGMVSAFLARYAEALGLADAQAVWHVTGFAEHMGVIDRGFQANAGYGLQPYGLSGYGGLNPLNLILQGVNESMSVADAFYFFQNAGLAETAFMQDFIAAFMTAAFADNLAVADAMASVVFGYGVKSNDAAGIADAILIRRFSPNAGYGLAAYGTSGYGGIDES